MDVQLHTFLTSALDAGKWSAPRPGSLTAGDRETGTHESVFFILRLV